MMIIGLICGLICAFVQLWLIGALVLACWGCHRAARRSFERSGQLLDQAINNKIDRLAERINQQPTK
jgi:hypothetical protein